VRTDAPKPPPFPVGAQLRYTGTRHIRVGLTAGARDGLREDWVDIVAPGMTVTICEVRNGRRGTGQHLRDADGFMFYDEEQTEPIYDETKDGWSVYRVEAGGRTHGRCINVESADEWERIVSK
jgi:hypothetical protein